MRKRPHESTVCRMNNDGLSSMNQNPAGDRPWIEVWYLFRSTVHWVVPIVVAPGISQRENFVFSGPCLRTLLSPVREGNLGNTHTRNSLLPIREIRRGKRSVVDDTIYISAGLFVVSYNDVQTHTCAGAIVQ
jgi:hypothetical protein